MTAGAGQYEQAAAVAGQVDPRSASDAGARTVRAWSLARADHPDLAAAAFADAADRYPQLPAREEDRLMAAQALLAQDRAGDAEGAFLAAADSSSTAAQRMAQWAAAPDAAARALVASRATDVLLTPDVWRGKAWVFPDSAGVQADALRTVGTGGTAVSPDFVSPATLSIANVSARMDSVAGRAPNGGLTLVDRDALQRAVFTSEPSDAAGSDARTAMVHAVHVLHDADVGVAIGNAALASRRSNLALQIQLLERERASIAAAGDSLGPMFGRLSARRGFTRASHAACRRSGSSPPRAVCAPAGRHAQSGGRERAADR